MSLFFRVMLIAFAVMLVPLAAVGQNFSDVYLVDITLGESIEFGTPVNITNHVGYDNQPSFLPDSSAFIYASERREGETTQNDIYLYELSTEETFQLTDTPLIDEYSPMITPDGEHISAVLAEGHLADGDYALSRVWRLDFDEEGKSTKKPWPFFFGYIERIGYYDWHDDRTVLMFVMLPEGDDLRVEMWMGDVVDGSTQSLLENIGRCIKKIPDQTAMSFVHEVSESERMVKKLDMDGTYLMTDIIPMLEDSNDFEWTPGGTLIAAQERSIYKYRPGTDDTWQEVAEFSDLDEDKKITRLAIAPNGEKMAFVVVHGCVIDGESYQAWQTNPDNPCQLCAPGTSNSAWSNAAEGTSCDDGKFCNGKDSCSAGTCSEHAGNPCGELEWCNEHEDRCESFGCSASASKIPFWFLLIGLCGCFCFPFLARRSRRSSRR